MLFVQSYLGRRMLELLGWYVVRMLELLGWDVVRMLAGVKNWQRQRSSFQDGGLTCFFVGGSTPRHVVHCCVVFWSSSLARGCL